MSFRAERGTSQRIARLQRREIIASVERWFAPLSVIVGDVGKKTKRRHCYRWSEGVVEQWSRQATQCITPYSMTSSLHDSYTPFRPWPPRSPLLAVLDVLDQSGRDRRYSFAAADRPQPFVRGRLDADARNIACQCACNFSSHFLNMWL